LIGAKPGPLRVTTAKHCACNLLAAVSFAIQCGDAGVQTRHDVIGIGKSLAIADDPSLSW
jgi:hypothetical protein